VLAGRIISAVLAVAVVVVAGVGYFVQQDVNDASAISDAATAAGDTGVAFSGGLNILLVGSDARTDAQGNPLSADELAALNTEETGGLNTDTIMVLHIPEGGGKATAVSIPRDTWISQDVVSGIEGPYSDGSTGEYKPNKINSFYGTAKAYTEEHLVNTGVTDAAERTRRSNEAGRIMLTKVVQKFTGLKIDHYAEVNLLGFYLLSKAIGGVPVCLNNAVDDPFSGAKFPAGQQTVEGSAALAFVRQRHGLPQGDLDRVRRQQVFLAAAANKVLSAGTLANPGKIASLTDTVKRSVIFDKNFDLLSFAEQMRNLSAGNVTFATLPTTGSETEAGTDALATDPAQIKKFFAGIVAAGGTATGSSSKAPSGSSAASSSVDPSTITVDAQNATATAGVAASALAKAAAAGFVKGDASDYAGDPQDATSIHYPAGAKDAATAVRKALGAGSLVEDADVADGHVLVVVGADLTGSGLRASGAALVQAAAPSGSVTTGSTAPEINAGAVACVN
jgi:LCP family protein required for cell wall assembly